MNEKTLDAQQSMELIARMIRNTRNRLERNAGRPFLIWGYTTVVISLFNFFARVAEMPQGWSLSWFLIPVIGCLLMRLFPQKKQTEPRTDIDRIVGMVWLTVSLALIPVFIFNIFHGLYYRADHFSLITLLMAVGTAATGLIVRSRLYTIAGFVGMALSTLFVFYDYVLGRLPKDQLADMMHNSIPYPYVPILLFAAIFTVMMIIPGHIMNYRSNHPKTSSHGEQTHV